MPKYYIESGEWRTVIISSDFINGVLDALEELILFSKKDLKLSNMVVVNEEGFISDLFANGCLEKRYIKRRKSNHVLLKNLKVSSFKKTKKDTIIFLPIKLLLPLIDCPNNSFSFIKDEECDGLNVID